MHCFVNLTLYDKEVYYEYLDAQAKGQPAKKIMIIQFAKSLTISIRSILHTSKTWMFPESSQWADSQTQHMHVQFVLAVPPASPLSNTYLGIDFLWA